MRTLAMLALALGAWAARAETLKTDADIKPFADRVMASVVNSGMASGFAAMRPYLLMGEGDYQSALLASQTRREEFAARYGKTVGFEYIGQKKVGESLLRLTYIEKTEKHALPWLFHFYRTRNGWVLDSFVWNDQASQLFNVTP